MIMTVINTFIKMTPIILFAATSLNWLLFDDIRGLILAIGILFNFLLAYGFQQLMKGALNKECSFIVGQTPDDFFNLPAQPPQIIGFFLAFMVMNMYEEKNINVVNIFIMLLILFLSIWSLNMVSCMNYMDAGTSSFIGIGLGIIYYNIVKGYYTNNVRTKSSIIIDDLTDTFFK